MISLGDFPLEQAERLVVLRKERQRRFRGGKLKLWVILDEAALRRPVAGPEVQLTQLRYLREACASPALTLRTSTRFMRCGPGPNSPRRPAVPNSSWP